MFTKSRLEIATFEHVNTLNAHWMNILERGSGTSRFLRFQDFIFAIFAIFRLVLFHTFCNSLRQRLLCRNPLGIGRVGVK